MAALDRGCLTFPTHKGLGFRPLQVGAPLNSYCAGGELEILLPMQNEAQLLLAGFTLILGSLSREGCVSVSLLACFRKCGKLFNGRGSSSCETG